jgi:hypothetical protein
MGAEAGDRFQEFTMRLPRYSLQTLLAITAIIAAVLGAWRFQRLSRQHAAVAAMHRKAQWEVSQQRDILAKGVSRREGQSYNPDEALKFARSAWEAELIRDKFASRANFADALRNRVHELTELATYHAKLHDKYERAAAYPWRSVAPDPRKPE